MKMETRAVSVLEGILNNVCECALETYPAAENSQAPGTGYAHLLTPVECVACQSFKKSGEIDGPRRFSGVIALQIGEGRLDHLLQFFYVGRHCAFMTAPDFCLVRDRAAP
jgi:hypothetical protein